MTRAHRISVAPHAIFRKLGGDGGGVVLHLRTTAYFRLNALGAAIWQVVEQPTTLDDLMSRLREMIEDAPEEMESDVTRFLNELTARDLVVLEPAS